MSWALTHAKCMLKSYWNPVIRSNVCSANILTFESIIIIRLDSTIDVLNIFIFSYLPFSYLCACSALMLQLSAYKLYPPSLPFIQLVVCSRYDFFFFYGIISHTDYRRACLKREYNPMLSSESFSIYYSVPKKVKKIITFHLLVLIDVNIWKAWWFLSITLLELRRSQWTYLF